MAGSRCEISMDKAFYCPGDIIKGFVNCHFIDEVVAREIRIRFKGYARVHWKVGKSERSDKQEFFELESNLIAEQTTYQPGDYSYPFVFNLPMNLPSSVREYNGKIKYTAYATVDIPWAIDFTAKKNIFVYNYTDLNKTYSLREPAVFVEEGSVSSFFSSNQTIKVVVQLPKRGYVPDEMIYFTCRIENYSTVKVVGVEFNFVQGFKLIIPSSTKEILSLKGQKYELTNGVVLPSTEQTWDLQMRVPKDVYNGNLDYCHIMEIFWELRGEVCLPLLHFNIKIRVPIIIGSVPLVTAPVAT